MSTPTFATHKLIDGLWVPKAQSSAPVPASNPIGFRPQTPATAGSITVRDGVTLVNGTRWYDRRKDCLRAIEIAAGKALVSGRDPEAISMIRRGRLGSQEDNLKTLNTLLQRYQAAA